MIFGGSILLGKPLNLKMTALGGGEIDLARLRGYVVVVIFWSADSPHSLLWLRDFRILVGDTSKRSDSRRHRESR